MAAAVLLVPLSHPEWFVYFMVRIASRHADIAQRCIAQAFELAPRTRPPLPFRDAQLQLIPMGTVRAPEDRHCYGAHRPAP
jgi:hypothetical protein